MDSDRNTEAAYAAGLFDGEGCVLIAYPRSGNKSRRRYHRLDVSVSNTDIRALVWLKEHFEGRINKLSRFGRSRDAWQWRANDGTAETFLQTILPFVIIKREQVEIAIAFRQTIRHEPGARRVKGGAWEPKLLINSALEAQREQMRTELSALKRAQ